MPERFPSSISWLGALVMLAVGVAAVSLSTLDAQTRTAARSRAEAITGGSVDRGKAGIADFGCGSCHVITGIAGANGKVGPDLRHIGKRAELAGKLRNDPEAMVRWLMRPQSISPQGGMPNQGVGKADARSIAAYLYAQN